MGGTTLPAVFLKLLNAVIVRLFGHLGELKSDFLFTLRNLYIIFPSLGNQIFISVYCFREQTTKTVQCFM